MKHLLELQQELQAVKYSIAALSNLPADTTLEVLELASDTKAELVETARQIECLISELKIC